MLTSSASFPKDSHPGNYFVLPTTTWGQIVAAIAITIIAAAIALAPLSWLIIALVMTTGAILALIYPWLAWLALAFALPIASGMQIGPALLTEVIFAGAMSLWLAAAISQRQAFNAPRLPIWTVALYLLVLYLSSIRAADLDEALKEVVKWIEFGAILVVLPMAIPSKYIPWLVAALLSAAAIQGIYGLYQFIYRIGPEWFVIQGRYMRASGVFGQPNPYAGYLGLSFPVAFSLSLWGIQSFASTKHFKTLLWTLFYLFASLCIGVGLIASWSRGGWLGAVGGVVVVLAFFNRRTAMLLGIGCLTLIATAFIGALTPNWIPAAITSRVADIPAYLGFIDILTLEVTDENFAVIERVAHWVAALRMWELSPWLGVGPGNYATIYPSVALPRWSDPLGHAHNIYLNVLGETGILGLLTFLLMWTSLIVWLFHHLRQTFPQNSWSRAFITGVLGVIAHLTIHNFFDNLFVQGMYLHVAFWMAAIAALATTVEATPRCSNWTKVAYK